MKLEEHQAEAAKSRLGKIILTVIAALVAAATAWVTDFFGIEEPEPTEETTTETAPAEAAAPAEVK